MEGNEKEGVAVHRGLLELELAVHDTQSHPNVY